MRNKELTIAEIADIVGGEISGDAAHIIKRVSSLEKASKDDISFLTNRKFASQLNTTQAGCVLLSDAQTKPKGVNLIVCENPYLAYALAAQALDTSPRPANNISENADIDSSVQMGENVSVGSGAVIAKNCRLENNVIVGANCTIGENSLIGENTLLHANTTIYHDVSIGQSCIFHSGAVIGSDGFGYASDADKWVKIPQTGGVSIGDRVEIGANTTIDRGALNDTIIEDGVKIDNLCHIAHNVFIGENTAIAACSGVAGSTTIGKSCTFSGRTSVVGHLNIAPGSHFTVGTFVSRSNDTPGIFSSGTGTQDNKLWKKNVARFKQLDEMAKRLKRLERQLEQIGDE